MSIVDCEVVGGLSPGEAPGAAARDRRSYGVNVSTSDDCSDVEIRQCRFVGMTDSAVSAMGSKCSGHVARVTVVDTTVERGPAAGAPCRYGFCVNPCSQFQVQDCRMEGLQMGVRVEGGKLKATRLRVSEAEHGLQASRFFTPACVELIESELHLCRSGVLAVGRDVQASLLRGVIIGAGPPGTACVGAAFRKGSIGRLDTCKIVQVDHGVIVGDNPEEAEQPDFGDAFGKFFTAISERRGVNEAGGKEGVADARAVSQVTMLNVAVSGAVHGVAVRPTGNLDATGVTVLKSGVGFSIEGTSEAVNCKMTGCSALGCGASVMKQT